MPTEPKALYPTVAPLAFTHQELVSVTFVTCPNEANRCVFSNNISEYFSSTSSSSPETNNVVSS